MYIYTFLEVLQELWLNHFPEQLIPMPHNHFSKETSPDIQHKCVCWSDMYLTENKQKTKTPHKLLCSWGMLRGIIIYHAHLRSCGRFQMMAQEVKGWISHHFVVLEYNWNLYFNFFKIFTLCPWKYKHELKFSQQLKWAITLDFVEKLSKKC